MGFSGVLEYGFETTLHQVLKRVLLNIFYKLQLVFNRVSLNITRDIFRYIFWLEVSLFTQKWKPRITIKRLYATSRMRKIIVCDIITRYWLSGKVDLYIVIIKITCTLVFYLLHCKKMYNNGFLFYDKSIHCILSKTRQMHYICPLCLENCVLHLRGYTLPGFQACN